MITKSRGNLIAITSIEIVGRVITLRGAIQKRSHKSLYKSVTKNE